MKRLVVVAMAIAVAVVGAGCESSAKTPSSFAPRATSSSTVPKNRTVVLLTHDAFAVSKAVLADFTSQTGYKVKLSQPCDAGCMVNAAILRKDHPIADALFGVDNTFLTRALNAGIFDPYTPRGFDMIRPDVYVDSQHRVTPIDTGNVCVIDDRSWFDHAGRPPEPKTLDDLTNPKYKNLTVVENAATSSPGLAFLLATIAAKGDAGWRDYWRKLRTNGVRVVDDWTQAYQTDFTAGGGSGDRPIVVSYGSDPTADVVNSSPHRATPRAAVLASTCFRQFEFAGVLHGARNPAGAQALIDFFLSRRFQEDMPLQMYVNPVTVNAQLPAVYQNLTVNPSHAYTIDPQTIATHRDEWIKEWTDITVQ